MTQIQSRLELAIEAAREAGEITLRYFRQPDLAVELKDDRSPVTAADREAETHLRKRIAATFPDDAILGEEWGQTPGTSGFRWTLDPIDGTKSFVAGVPLYAAAIGILAGDEGRAGLLYAPATDEMVYASRGHGAWYVGGGAAPRSTHVSTVARIDEAMLVTTEVKSFTRYRDRDAVSVFVDLQGKARLTRTWGDAYGYMLVATGRADIMVDPALNLWDAAPLLPIIEEAGGRFTNWKGEPTIDSGEGIGTNGLLHDTVLRLVAGW